MSNFDENETFWILSDFDKNGICRILTKNRILSNFFPKMELGNFEQIFSSTNSGFAKFHRYQNRLLQDVFVPHKTEPEAGHETFSIYLRIWKLGQWLKSQFSSVASTTMRCASVEQKSNQKLSGTFFVPKLASAVE